MYEFRVTSPQMAARSRALKSFLNRRLHTGYGEDADGQNSEGSFSSTGTFTETLNRLVTKAPRVSGYTAPADRSEIRRVKKKRLMNIPFASYDFQSEGARGNVAEALLNL